MKNLHSGTSRKFQTQHCSSLSLPMPIHRMNLNSLISKCLTYQFKEREWKSVPLTYLKVNDWFLLIWSNILGTWCPDMTYRSRRNLLGAIPTNTIAYHLFDIQYSADKSNYSIKLLRKAKKPFQHFKCN